MFPAPYPSSRSGRRTSRSSSLRSFLNMVALALVLGAASALSSTPARAQTFIAFGVNEMIWPIAHTGVVGPNGKTLPLAYKVSMYVMGASWWMHDDGYVLMNLPNTREYFPLSPADIASYQRAGVLPDPLPPYALKPIDFIFGFSGWILVAGVVVWTGTRHLWQQARRHLSGTD